MNPVQQILGRGRLVGLALGAGVLASALLQAHPAGAQGGYLFDNYNTGGVQNATHNQPSFTLSQDAFISTIATYHFNNGRGASGQVSITLTRNLGVGLQNVGTFAAAAQDTNEVAAVNQTVPAGTYIV